MYKCTKFRILIVNWLHRKRSGWWNKQAKKELMRIEEQKPLKLKTEFLSNGKTFCKSLLEYMKSDKDVQQFYEDGDWGYNSFSKELSVGSGWNTGQRFLLKYMDVVELAQGLGLRFNFQILKRKLVEEGWDEKGEPFISTKHEFVPTDLNFYIQYFGDNFNVRTDKSTSSNINDFEFIINAIARKLGEL